MNEIEKPFEKDLTNLAIRHFKELQDVMKTKHPDLSDRQGTLALHYYFACMIALCWKDVKISTVLEDMAKVRKTIEARA